MENNIEHPVVGIIWNFWPLNWFTWPFAWILNIFVFPITLLTWPLWLMWNFIPDSIGFMLLATIAFFAGLFAIVTLPFWLPLIPLVVSLIIVLAVYISTAKAEAATTA